VTTNGDRPAAGDPVMDFDSIYPIHDGLEPDELDIEVEFEDYEWRDRWTTEDKRGVVLIVALIAVAIVCYRLGELSALGWFN
jgi:hypothetical protein